MILKKNLLYCLLTVSSYHIVSFGGVFTGLLPLFFLGLFKQIEINSGKKAFYWGLANGMLIYSIHLRFFFNIFSTAAIVLWLILALWLALFFAAASHFDKRLSAKLKILAIPALYFSLEFFRSELYMLKFSWGTAGFQTFKNAQFLGVNFTGLYGFSLLLFVLVSLAMTLKNKLKIAAISTLCLLLTILSAIPQKSQLDNTTNSPLITGIQLEFPDKKDLLAALDEALTKNPQSDIFMLSEYAINPFSTGVPQEILDWCRDNKKYIVGGAKFKHETIEDEFYNTATVINPQGGIEFKQVKCTPIQFFKDGAAAQSQQLWNSPWGKIGLCICYDLSYSRVTDELIKMGRKLC